MAVSPNFAFLGVHDAQLYSKGYQIRGEETLCNGSPWGKYKVPSRIKDASQKSSNIIIKRTTTKSF